MSTTEAAPGSKVWYSETHNKDPDPADDTEEVERNRDWVRQNANEIVHVMRWWITENEKRKRTAMMLGGVNEVVQESYLGLLNYPPRDGFTLTTVACNSVRWVTSRMINEFRSTESLRKDYDAPDMSPEVVDEIAINELREKCWSVVERCLSSRKNTEIVRCRMEGGSIASIASQLKVTRQRIHQIANDKIKLLGAKENAEKFKGFM